MDARDNTMQNIVFTTLILAVGMLQGTGVLAINGIVPNITLALLIVIAFVVHDIVFFSFLTVLGAMTLGLFPIDIMTRIAFVTTIAIAMLASRYIASKAWVNTVLLTAMGTSLFYLLIDLQFMYTHPRFVAGEMFYNVAIAVGALMIMRTFMHHETDRTSLRRISL